jgi:GntR family transcriptional regulator
MAMIRTLRAQAADALRAIIDEQYEPGERLPAEPELAKRLNLSRNTVREAIGQLVHEGRLDRRWGVGTTVLSPRAQAAFSVTDVVPIRQIIEASGHKPSLLRFRTEIVQPSEEVVAELELDEGENALYVERLFAIDDTPAVWLRDWCRSHVGDTAIDVAALEDISVDLPALIRSQTGQVLDRLEGRIDAVPRAGDFLSPESEKPLVQISQNVVTREGLALVYSIVQFDTAVVDLTIQRAFSQR